MNIMITTLTLIRTLDPSLETTEEIPGITLDIAESLYIFHLVFVYAIYPYTYLSACINVHIDVIIYTYTC
jgi:hypothetical protein